MLENKSSGNITIEPPRKQRQQYTTLQALSKKKEPSLENLPKNYGENKKFGSCYAEVSVGYLVYRTLSQLRNLARNQYSIIVLHIGLIRKPALLYLGQTASRTATTPATSSGAGDIRNGVV